MADFQERDLAQIRITLGDRNKDATHDATVELWGKVPWVKDPAPRKLLDLGPFNVPSKEILGTIGQVAGLLSPPMANVVKGVLGVLGLLVG